MKQNRRTHGLGSVFNRGAAESPAWYIQYSSEGQQVKESVRKAGYSNSESGAMTLLKKRISDKQIGTVVTAAERNVKVSEMLDDLLDHYKMRKSFENYEKEKLNIERHLRPRFGFIRASQLNTANIEAWQRDVAPDLSPATVNRLTTLLRRAYTLATQRTPPKVSKTQIPYFPMLPVKNVRTGFLEDADFEKLYAELNPDVRLIALFAYLTGSRRGEVLGLKWADVDLAEGFATLRDTKNGETRMVPLAPRLVDALKAVPRSGSAVFCYAETGEPILDFRREWERACTAVNMTGLHVHDLRRSCVRNLVRTGAHERVAMDISGHKTRSVFERYNITDMKDRRAAVARLGSSIPKISQMDGSEQVASS